MSDEMEGGCQAARTGAWPDDGAGGCETEIVMQSAPQAQPELAWSTEPEDGVACEAQKPDPAFDYPPQYPDTGAAGTDASWRASLASAAPILFIVAVVALVAAGGGWIWVEHANRPPSPSSSPTATLVPAPAPSTVTAPPVTVTAAPPGPAPTPPTATPTTPTKEAQPAPPTRTFTAAQENEYLRQIRETGPGYTSPDAILPGAEEVCVDLDNGTSYDRIVALLLRNRPDVTESDRARYLAITIRVLCPDHADVLP